MSKCISHNGEYSEHQLDEAGDHRFVCKRCWVFDEDLALAHITALETAHEAIGGWRISGYIQSQGWRVVIDYDDESGRQTSYPVNTPKTIAEIVADHDRTWPHSAVGAVLPDQRQQETNE